MRLAAALAVLSCAMGVAGAATLTEPSLPDALRDVVRLDVPDAPAVVVAPAADAPLDLLPSVPLLPADLVLVDLAPLATRAPAPTAVLVREEAPPAPAPRVERAPAAAKAERLDADPDGAGPVAPERRAFAPPEAALQGTSRAFAPPDATGPGPAAVAAAAGGLAALAALAGLALYHRIRPNAALENETRKTIFETVCQRPGLGVHAIAASAGVSYSTATYHLERLVAAGMLVMTPDGNKLCYYKNGGAFTETERKILPILKNEEASKLLDAILDSPGTYRAALAERLGVTATTINWHLKRLREAGLVREMRQGRNAYLYVDAQAMRAAMAPLAQKVGASDPHVTERLRRYASQPGPASS